MNREEAKDYLLKIAHSLGGIGVEYYSTKDGNKMIEAIDAIYYEKEDDDVKRRNNMSDRERIKQFIESTMRGTCDDISDIGFDNTPMVVFEKANRCLLIYSTIYKNMGFNKEGK